MFIQPVPCDSDAFSHGKGGYNGTNSKSFDMPETESGEGSSDNQADYIEADLDFWICHRSDLGQFPWEKVSRDNREITIDGVKYELHEGESIVMALRSILTQLWEKRNLKCFLW